jgi:hypothetical protein
MMFYATPGINADTVAVKDGRMCKADGPKIRTALDAAPVGDNVNVWLGAKDDPAFPLLYQGKGVAPKPVPAEFLGGLFVPQGAN